MSVTLDPTVERAIRQRWPERADHWMADLPERLDVLCHELGVTPRRCFPSRFALVVEAESPSGAALVIRSTPDPGAGHQTAVLERLAAADLAPVVHRVDRTPCAVWTVMDAVRPGTPLDTAEPSTIPSDGVVKLLRGLAAGEPGPADLPDLTEWITPRLTDPPLDDQPPHGGPASEHERLRAMDVLGELARSRRTELCHGDLSPGNALIAGSRLLLIDPRGINGEAAYDVAALALKTSRHDVTLARAAAAGLARTVDVDPDRAEQWAIVAAAATV
ncbi:MAG: phosphotransferase [Pseudonocardia sp.]|nr:phosphotransferase [Pseudonocardia sp.]